MFALVGLELWGLHLDRDEHDADQAQARCEQIDRFGKIADELEASIKESEAQFSLTSRGLENTLNATNTAVRQTQPHAVAMVLGFVMENPPIPPQPFQSGIVYHFDIQYGNDGNETAQLTRRLAKVYIGKPDDTGTQRTLAQEFEKVWDQKPNDDFGDVVKNAPRYWTEDRTFSQSEFKDMNEKLETVYVLSRLQYRDSTGVWWSDRCEYIEMIGKDLYLRVTKPCHALANPRYRPPRK